MKAKLISNDPSLNLMFRLGGIEIEQVDRIEESLDKFKTSVKDDNLAVLILSRTIYIIYPRMLIIIEKIRVSL